MSLEFKGFVATDASYGLQCEYQSPNNRINENGVGAGWAKGAYVCKCRKGYYSTSQHQSVFDGILVEGW